MRWSMPDHRALLARLPDALAESIHFSQYSAPMVGVVGVFGFPIYYYVWTYLFPQPYESLLLRLIGTLLCVPLALYRFWPEHWKRYFLPYWLLSVGYILPFFFTYMLLMNDLSLAWTMSTMSALFLLVLAVHHWLPIILLFLMGSLLAWVAFLSNHHGLLSLSTYLSQLPVYLFVIVAGALFNYTSLLVRDEKLRAVSAVGRNIAHELRTPLLGMKGAAQALRHYLPMLVESYRTASAAGLHPQHIRNSRLELLARAADRIDDEIDYSNVIIDMLLLSGKQDGLRMESNEIQSARETVDNALRRYPFPSDEGRSRVSLIIEQDFTFRGSSLLVTHVIFNLLKNALHSITKARKGEVTIRITATSEGGRITVYDTGLGIPHEEQHQIFRYFYSSKSIEEGSGIGLSFCKAVMKGLGGDIVFQSEPGEFSEFTLVFP